MNITAIAWFHRKWKRDEKTGCWIWTGSKNNIGYGNFKVFGRVEKAHRVSWTIHKGEIPKGLNVLHRCHNRACVNPEHLHLGTQQDNMNDRWNKLYGQN